MVFEFEYIKKSAILSLFLTLIIIISTIMRPKNLVALSLAIMAQIYYLIKGYIVKQKKIKLLERIKALK